MTASVSHTYYPASRTRLPEFDLLRSFAILGVVIIHVSGAFLPEVERGSSFNLMLLAINQLQRFCVPTFILLSGFWLSYVPQNFENPNATLKKRLLRVVPPYVLWSLIFEFFYIFIVKNRSLSNIIPNLILGKSVYVYYFIILILQFYLLWWILVKFKIKTIGTRGLAIALGVQLGSTLVRYSALFGIIPPLHYLSDRLILDWVFFFILGWYIGQHYERVRPWVISRKKEIWMAIACAIALTIYERNAIYFSSLTINDANNFTKLSSQIYAVLFFLGCLPFDRTLKPLKTLSRYSFAIYLIHAPIVNLEGRLLIHFFVPIFPSFLLLLIGVLVLNVTFIYALEKLLPKSASRYLLGL